MTVEYFTPSKEDIEQAPEHLEILRLYMIYNDTGHLIGHDFVSLYTQEEKDAIRAQLESVSIEFTSPVAALSVLPDAQIKPSYHVKEVKTINGQKVTFYGQDLSKDKK